MLPKALGRLHRHRAFFDDEPITAGERNDLTRDCFDSAEICLAIFKGRSAHANENHGPLCDCFGRGRKAKGTRCGISRNESVEVRLEKRKLSSLELTEFAG